MASGYMEMPHKIRNIKISRVWPFGVCFLTTKLKFLWHWLCKNAWDGTTWPHHLGKNGFVLQETASLANSQFGCSGECEVGHWRMPHKRNAAREDQSKATSLYLSCQAGSPVGTCQACCHQLSLQKSSPSSGQRDTKAPASPASQHMREGLPTIYLKYHLEVNPVSHNSDQIPGSLFIRERGRVVEAVSESSISHFILRRGWEMGSDASRVCLCLSSSSHLHPCRLHLKKGAWETNQISLTVIISTVLLSCSIQIFILPLSAALSLFLFENSSQAFWTSHRMQSKQKKHEKQSWWGRSTAKLLFPPPRFLPRLALSPHQPC